MNKNVVFDEKNISKERVLNYLTKVKNDFSIPLDTQVNLADYSSKITKNAFIIIAKDILTNEDIGLIAMYINDKHKKTAFITLISVNHQYQGLEIGKQLLELCIFYANTLRFQLISLEVNLMNTKAIKLYHNNSFKISHHTTEETYIMIKKLSKDAE